MVHAEPVTPMVVEVAYSPKPGEVVRVRLELAPGSTVEQALHASGLLLAHPDLQLHTLNIGIWGKRASAEAPLRDHDRVEIYRPLRVDPKEARRLRYRTSSPKR